VKETLTAVLFLAGASLALLAAVGVLRMPDLFTRMQASTKASTLGLGCLLIGLALHLPEPSILIRAGSIVAFVMLTAPVAAHVIARAAYSSGVPMWKGSIVDERRDDERASEGSRAGGPEAV
jgi:multicomponent Na+:H+ antiporter subunit G